MRQTHFISTVREPASRAASCLNELGLNGAKAHLKGATPDEAKLGKSMQLVRTGWNGSSSRGLSMICWCKFIQRLHQNTGMELNWELMEVLFER